MDQNSRLLRIGIFYDGNYFFHVSNYYCYAHARRARLSIPGIHEFIKQMISEKEQVNERMCQIVDCHYFRGRLSAKEADARRILLNERIFDDILMREGVVTHYLPMSRGTEKGVDVSLALETLELTIFKQFNIVVLIASDGDYVPLVRKLNSLGTRVMVLAWDFEYMDDNGNLRYTGTSQRLLNEVSYPLLMDQIIDGKVKFDRVNVDTLFVLSQAASNNGHWEGHEEEAADDVSDLISEDGEYIEDDDNFSSEEQNGNYAVNRNSATGPSCGNSSVPAEKARFRGKIVQIKNGYGFIAPENNTTKNLFFFWGDVENCDFNALNIGDAIEYEIGRNDRGECAIRICKL